MDLYLATNLDHHSMKLGEVMLSQSMKEFPAEDQRFVQSYVP